MDIFNVFTALQGHFTIHYLSENREHFTKIASFLPSDKHVSPLLWATFDCSVSIRICIRQPSCQEQVWTSVLSVFCVNRNTEHWQATLNLLFYLETDKFYKKNFCYTSLFFFFWCIYGGILFLQISNIIYNFWIILKLCGLEFAASSAHMMLNHHHKVDRAQGTSSISTCL